MPKAGEGAPASSSAPAAPSPSSSIQNPQSTIQNPSALLLAVAACDADAPAIAARFNLPLETYLDWLSAPDTARRLSALVAQSEAVRLKRLEARHESALETLHALHQKAEENADPVERRRAATAVARFSVFSRAQSSNISRLFRGLSFTPAAANPHTGALDPHDSEASGDHASPNPKSAIQNPRSNRVIRPAFILHTAAAITPPKPDPSHTPAHATSRLLHLLQTCDEPRRGHGLRALFSHFTPIWQGYVGANNANDFARAPIDAYRTLINHRSVVLHPTRFQEPPEWVNDGPICAHQSFDFVDIDNRNWSATFEFSRQSGQHRAPWLINRVHLAQGSAAAFPTSSTPSSPLPPTSDIRHPTSNIDVTSDIPHPTSDIPIRDAPLSPEDLAADAARLADLDRPRLRPPPEPLAPEIPDLEPDDEPDEPTDETALPAARRPARISAY